MDWRINVSPFLRRPGQNGSVFFCATHTDTFITVCGDKADALREGQSDWDHLTAWEKENDVVHFSVGLIRVQLTEDHGKRSFEQALLPDGIFADGDIYDVAKEWK